jgi:hypothetical protein
VLYSDYENGHFDTRPSISIAEQLAARLGVSRSETLFKGAGGLSKAQDDLITSRLNRIYGRCGSSLTLERLLVHRALPGTSGNAPGRDLVGFAKGAAGSDPASGVDIDRFGKQPTKAESTP